MPDMMEVAKGSLSQRTYEALRNGLILGNFRPGERLLLQDLATRLGTSITPVREACLRLVSEQALELQSGRFVLVPATTRTRYWQIRLIRLALEGLAAELAVQNVNETDIKRLSAIQDAFVIAESTGVRDEARRLNREFHFGVYELCRLPILINQIGNMWVSMGPMFSLYYSRPPEAYAGAEEHVHLLEALKGKDGPAARRAIVRDIERGGTIFLRYFDSKEAAESMAATGSNGTLT